MENVGEEKPMPESWIWLCLMLTLYVDDNITMENGKVFQNKNNIMNESTKINWRNDSKIEWTKKISPNAMEDEIFYSSMKLVIQEKNK